MRVLAIVPAFNEERSLPAVVAGLRRHAPGVDVCVVDDGSTDGTAEVARSLGATLLCLPVNLGIGGAVQAGYRWARDRGYDVAVQVDGDGQHDTSFLPALVEEVATGRADLAVGSRFAGPRVAGAFRSTWSRRAGIRYLSAMLRLRCGARVSDPTSGFRAAGRGAIELFARSYPPDYPEPESIAVAARAGLRVTEVPVRMSERLHGESSIDLGRSFYYLVKVTMALVLLPTRLPGRGGPGVRTDLIPLELQVVSILVLAAFLLWVVRLVRTQRLSLRDSLVWVVTTLVATAVALFPGILVRAAHLLGFQVASNALFGAAVLYLAVNVLVNTVAGSQNAARIRRLAQECASLRAELEAERAARRAPGSARAGRRPGPALRP